MFTDDKDPTWKDPAWFVVIALGIFQSLIVLSILGGIAYGIWKFVLWLL